MKKIFAALAAAIMISVLTTGCFGMGQKTAVATGDEALSQNAADYEDQSTDEIDLRALFLNIALSRSVARSSGRFADTSVRHLITPLDCSPLQVSRL